MELKEQGIYICTLLTILSKNVQNVHKVLIRILFLSRILLRMLFKNKNFQAIQSCQELLNSGTSIDRKVVENILEQATLKKAKEGLEDNTYQLV